jgi:hypothetical protein
MPCISPGVIEIRVERIDLFHHDQWDHQDTLLEDMKRIGIVQENIRIQDLGTRTGPVLLD